MDRNTAIIIAAAVYNFGVLIPSRFLTNENFHAIDPVLFDRNGCVMVLLWGFAHLSVAWNYDAVPYLLFVFAAEKLFYVIYWMRWLYKRQEWENSWAVKEADFFTKSFFYLYGLADLVFFVPALLTISITTLRE
mmetsp:Transcript_21212/g.32230  ORF Transcript_21212/g.32230 Transcript_21212/m.32230 type:complete len:134 (-) Transcript_21212:145-546(-)